MPKLQLAMGVVRKVFIYAGTSEGVKYLGGQGPTFFLYNILPKGWPPENLRGEKWQAEKWNVNTINIFTFSYNFFLNYWGFAHALQIIGAAKEYDTHILPMLYKLAATAAPLPTPMCIRISMMKYFTTKIMFNKNYVNTNTNWEYGPLCLFYWIAWCHKQNRWEIMKNEIPLNAESVVKQNRHSSDDQINLKSFPI